MRSALAERLSGTPKGNRTPVLALRGLRPRPLDDGGVQEQILARAFICVNSHASQTHTNNFLDR